LKHQNLKDKYTKKFDKAQHPLIVP
jgi:hypothetical protein